MCSNTKREFKGFLHNAPTVHTPEEYSAAKELYVSKAGVNYSGFPGLQAIMEDAAARDFGKSSEELQWEQAQADKRAAGRVGACWD